ECGYQNHAGTGNPDCDRKGFPHADQDGDLGGKSTEARNAHRRGRSDDKDKGCERKRPIQVHQRQLIKIAGVSTAIDHSSSHGEEECTDHAVRKHWQNRAGNAEDDCRGNGQMTARTAKTRNKTGKAQDCNCGVNWNRASSFKSSEPELTYAAMIPMKTSAPPKKE